MESLLKRKILGNILFFACVVLLVLISTYKALYFHFWRDDWPDLWMAVNRFSDFFRQSSSFRMHPGSGLEKMAGTFLFGTNPFYWQAFGLLLKVLDSMAIYLMMMAVSRSRKAAMLASAFFASTILGSESFTWISAHTSAIAIIPFCLGIYFWIKEPISISSRRKYFLAFLFLTITVAVSPARGIMIILVPFIWDILTLLQKSLKRSFYYLIAKAFLMAVLVFAVVTVINYQFSSLTGNSILDRWNEVLRNWEAVINYLSSIGNLLIGWFYPVPEVMGFTNINFLSVISFLSIVTGFLFLFLTLIIAIFFCFNKSNGLKIIVFFLIWILLGYLPSWIFSYDLVVGSSHRYLTISAVGVVCLLGFLVAKIHNRLCIPLALSFILVNLLLSNNLLGQQEIYRSYNIVQPLYDQIDADVPQEEKDSIFIYSGDGSLWRAALNWSGSTPFGIKRGIKQEDDFPIVTGDLDLVKKLLCQENVNRPSLIAWTIQKKRIPLDHVYAWVLRNGILENVSEKARIEIAAQLDCTPF